MIQQSRVRHGPRKEPRQGRSLVLVDAILDAATRLLPTFSLERLTTNRIAELAGVSIGSLYQYFPSKDAILARLMERDLETRERAFMEVLELHRGASLEEVVARLIERAREMFVRDSSFLLPLFVHAPRLHRLSEIINHRRKVGRALVEMLVSDYPEIRVDDLDRAAFVLTNAVMGVFQTAILDGLENHDLEALELDLNRLVLGFLRDGASVPRCSL